MLPCWAAVAVLEGTGVLTVLECNSSYSCGTFCALVALSVALKGLEQCPSLMMLYAGNNRLTSLEGLDACIHLWRVDVSYNKVRLGSHLLRCFVSDG